jgi:uncharacterized membrane protein
MIIFSMLPVSELRGAIPYGYFNGINIFIAFLFSVVFNSIAAILLFFFLEYLNHLFLKIKPYRILFDKVVNRARKKVGEKFEKYEYIGLMIFVAIPLPVTGAWTGTIGAWVLGLKKRKAIPWIIAGVLIAGIVVSIVTFTGVETFKLFLKSVK